MTVLQPITRLCRRLDKVIDRLDTIIKLLSTPRVMFDPDKIEHINLDDLKPGDLVPTSITDTPPSFGPPFDSRGNLYPAAEERKAHLESVVSAMSDPDEEVFAKLVLKGSMDVAESTDLEGE